jgi:hypothetical protein
MSDGYLLIKLNQWSEWMHTILGDLEKEFQVKKVLLNGEEQEPTYQTVRELLSKGIYPQVYLEKGTSPPEQLNRMKRVAPKTVYYLFHEIRLFFVIVTPFLGSIAIISLLQGFTIQTVLTGITIEALWLIAVVLQVFREWGLR